MESCRRLGMKFYDPQEWCLTEHDQQAPISEWDSPNVVREAGLSRPFLSRLGYVGVCWWNVAATISIGLTVRTNRCAAPGRKSWARIDGCWTIDDYNDEGESGPELGLRKYLHWPLPSLLHVTSSGKAAGWGKKGTSQSTYYTKLASHLGEPGLDSRRDRFQVFACGNRAGRCRWSPGFLGDLPFPPPYSPRFNLIGSQDLDVDSRPNISTPLHCKPAEGSATGTDCRGRALHPTKGSTIALVLTDAERWGLAPASLDTPTTCISAEPQPRSGSCRQFASCTSADSRIPGKREKHLPFLFFSHPIKTSSSLFHPYIVARLCDISTWLLNYFCT
ncbi:hypothetical protein PR048_002694 [Dryococelus australis]|uniref:Uncharacterized protein n=1 Tax=Dryococelus australis TaxID=614101 RepID=A0ABQ9IKY3_9NEOP|nr:hypothetical protein PR048_002694 [Dryococelus australis]